MKSASREREIVLGGVVVSSGHLVEGCRDVAQSPGLCLVQCGNRAGDRGIAQHSIDAFRGESLGMRRSDVFGQAGEGGMK